VSISATVKVMSAEEIAAKAGGVTPFFHWPQRQTHFAERQMRLRQLAGGHAMGDFLRFASDLARVQQAALLRFQSVPLPDHDALTRAAEAGQPPLPAVDWPRDPAWRTELRRMAADLRGAAPEGVRAALDVIDRASDDDLEKQADCLLTGVMAGLNLATAPVVAAALQVYWTHLVLSVQAHGGTGPLNSPFGRTDDVTVCPCCGSRPTASLTRSSGDTSGQRYLHCSLCSTQWYVERIKCSHCLSTKSIAYQSLELAGAQGDDDEHTRAGKAAVQAETCDDCGHYLKIMHGDRDPFVDPVADDLATVTLDLLVSEAGLQRHGVNLMLLFGDPEPSRPPEPGGA
jgi:FdhE protein